MPYKVIRSSSIQKLQRRVNNHLSGGWNLQGGVHPVAPPQRGTSILGQVVYIQALYRKK